MAKDNNVSRLEIFCSDSLVMPIKRMLLGMKGVYEFNEQLVVNAKPSKKGLVAKSGGSSLEMFAEYLRANKINSVSRQSVDHYCQTIGKPQTAGGFLIKRGQETGLLVKNKARSNNKKAFIYDVKG